MSHISCNHLKMIYSDHHWTLSSFAAMPHERIILFPGSGQRNAPSFKLWRTFPERKGVRVNLPNTPKTNGFLSGEVFSWMNFAGSVHYFVGIIINSVESIHHNEHHNIGRMICELWLECPRIWKLAVQPGTVYSTDYKRSIFLRL